mgnify:CR=1 FL=1
MWALSLAGSPAWSALTPRGARRPRATGTRRSTTRCATAWWCSGEYDAQPQRRVGALARGEPGLERAHPAGSPPSARYGHTAIYDPVRDRMVVFGGYDGEPPQRRVGARRSRGARPGARSPRGEPAVRAAADTRRSTTRCATAWWCSGDMTAPASTTRWALSLAGSPAWSALAPAGSAPSARSCTLAIYDPVRDRMVVFGGNDGTNAATTCGRSRSRGPRPGARLTPTGSPPPARGLTYGDLRSGARPHGGVRGI